MEVVSVINYKGGVGKTSLTANLGAELAWRRRRVLLIDLDAQASLTFSFISAEEWGRKYEADRTIKAWFDSFETGERITLSKLIECAVKFRPIPPATGNTLFKNALTTCSFQFLSLSTGVLLVEF